MLTQRVGRSTWIHFFAGLVAFLATARVARAQGLAVLDGREVVLPGSTVNLGGVAVGVPKDFALSLHNVAMGNSGSLQVTNIGIGGAAAGDLEVLTAMPVTIPADRSVTLRCRLTASVGGQRRAEITIKNTDQPNPYTFAVTATAANVLACNGGAVTLA